jgi:transcriptional regulator with AbiEi antitoxin domain of type IV toxin-antitoxin system
MNASSTGGRAVSDTDLAIALDEFGCEQHSVITWNQLLDAGGTPAWVKEQIRSGQLIRLAPRTYRFNGAPRNWKMRASAAVLSARAPTLISHRSAAWLYGIDEHQPGVIDITVPRHRRPRPRPGVQFHESRQFDVATDTAAVRDGLPVTGVARTILDSCSVVPGLPERLDLFDEARRQKLVAWAAGTKFARRVGLLLESSGLPTPVYEHPVPHPEGKYFIDLAYLTPRKVAVECIGKIGHDFERAFEMDPVRRNRLQLQGWIVIEVTWRRFVNAPESVVAEILQALSA